MALMIEPPKRNPSRITLETQKVAQQIDYYQDEAAKSLILMRQAIELYEETQDDYWLLRSFKWQQRSHHYYTKAERLLETI